VQKLNPETLAAKAVTENQQLIAALEALRHPNPLFRRL
jgi:hypothetical protein